MTCTGHRPFPSSETSPPCFVPTPALSPSPGMSSHTGSSKPGQESPPASLPGASPMTHLCHQLHFPTGETTAICPTQLVFPCAISSVSEAQTCFLNPLSSRCVCTNPLPPPHPGLATFPPKPGLTWRQGAHVPTAPTGKPFFRDTASCADHNRNKLLHFRVANEARHKPGNTGGPSPTRRIRYVPSQSSLISNLAPSPSPREGMLSSRRSTQ